MKIFTLLLLLSAVGFAQIPAGYYSSASGLTGYPLKSELRNIIENGHTDQGYSALLNLYNTSDNDTYYPNQGESINDQSTTILDMYSENPTGTDPYNFTFTDRCGNVSSNEGFCYNREHIFPQGRFNRRNPMRTDAHHVIPTDGQINGRRSSFPFGVVSNPTFTSLNGSKVGPNTTAGFSNTVFEPIDEFKGDIARMLLYFATRYENQYNDSSWDSHTALNDPRDGTQGQYYEQWYVDLLLSWHNADPVSQKEIDRNNDIYVYQGNRNPYIDNPQFVNMIWTTTASNEDVILSNISIYPNPSSTGTFFIEDAGISIDNLSIYDISGRQLNTQLDNNQFKINSTGIFIVRLSNGDQSRSFKVIVN